MNLWQCNANSRLPQYTAADLASLRELADDAAAAGEPSLAAEARRETACADEALRAAERELARELTAGGAEGDGAHGGGGEPLGAILDARAGVGGVEAAHFLGQLRTSWRLYATRRGWAWTTLRESFTEQGDPSELLASVKGAGAFGALRHEAGIHRVQRVPMAQRSSANAKKMQTSAVLCAVLPEAGGGAGGRDGESLVDPADVRIETKRASGAGGQHVNVTDSAVRLTHVPTGISVSVQAERSQLRNKERAMRVLEARLRAKRDAAVAADRRDTIDEQSGGNFLFGGDRRVRTYHFPQSRLTDHRVPGGGDVDLNAFLEVRVRCGRHIAFGCNACGQMRGYPYGFAGEVALQH